MLNVYDIHVEPTCTWSPVLEHLNNQDWYSGLSGGQRSKAELMRQIFLKSRCPEDRSRVFEYASMGFVGRRSRLLPSLPSLLLTSNCSVPVCGASLQVVLIDEALAPLDPVSKQLVQKQLKAPIASCTLNPGTS